MSILVLGGKGQLGQCLQKNAAEQGLLDIHFLDEVEGDILNTALLRDLVKQRNISWVINCAAYTAVDKAEEQEEIARKINKDGALNIAKVCKEFGVKLIHISTDFIFKGNSPKLLNETDPTVPVSVYGLTKLEGEESIVNTMEEYFILRTSWLYSEFENNFVKTMLKLGTSRTELGVIADQIGSPTYAIDLAKCVLDIIKSSETKYGIYHYSNEGAISWYDFSKAIFEIAGINTNVKPLRTDQYPTKAQRPAFSAMDKSKIKEVYPEVEVPYWRDSLKRCLSALEMQ